MATTIYPTPKWWSLFTAFSLIYRESPANYGIRTTSPLALNKDRLFARDGEYITSKRSASTWCSLRYALVRFALDPAGDLSRKRIEADMIAGPAWTSGPHKMTATAQASGA
jgi:hypothetical protein